MIALKSIICAVVTLLLFGLTACATNDTEAVAKLEVNDSGEYVFEDTHDAEDEIICKRQRINGSHIPQRVCKKKSQIEAEHEEVLESIGPLAPMAGDELQRLH